MPRYQKKMVYSTGSQLVDHKNVIKHGEVAAILDTNYYGNEVFSEIRITSRNGDSIMISDYEAFRCLRLALDEVEEAFQHVRSGNTFTVDEMK